ncbi:hypothetical protein DFA_04899 [Cavenderia fasciculata]|uniref:Uncharacterized protein n=1 Tax=Cavenderia fasciculata TaxID=261658 RepID=F4PMB9_CACFS|nr:uncharacterized protein DFA_04899 [Cavenderia fasciculata]EGG22769.1 hypothetical protein DFA_04899 [Cavenderia fasciculata]|eukprot:XP_004360620.1 hypothetical protein DFA_04899 [Cavenderia fasciculata]
MRNDHQPIKVFVIGSTLFDKSSLISNIFLLPYVTRKDDDVLTFSDIAPENYLRMVPKCNIKVIIYDVSNKESFEKVKEYKEIIDAMEDIDSKASTILVAMNCHLNDSNGRVVSSSTGRGLAQYLNIAYYEHDTDTAKSIRESFNEIIYKQFNITYINNNNNNNPLPNFKTINLNVIKPLALSLPLHIPPPQPHPLQLDQSILQRVFKSKVIMKEIFNQVQEIHKRIGRCSNKLSCNDEEFWCSSPYLVPLVEYRERHGFKPLIFRRHTFGFGVFLRNQSSNFVLVRNSFVPIYTMTEREKKETINDACIGGNVAVVEYLHKKLGYHWSVKGFLFSIAFNHLEVTKYIVANSIRKKEYIPTSSSAPMVEQPFTLTDAIIKLALQACDDFSPDRQQHYQFITNYYKTKANLSFMDRLSQTLFSSDRPN